jgi:phage baseplate assembly protein V
MQKLIAVGRVSTVYPERCTARVYFEDRDAVSRELHVGIRGSQNTKDYWMPEPGEAVVCAFLPNSSEGFILCSYYGGDDKPPVKERHKRHISFEDGTSIEYDSKTHTLSIECAGSVNIKASGNVTVIGDVIADGISLKNHTHMGVHGATSPPIGG